MDFRRANRAYLYMILATIGLVLVVSLWYLNGGFFLNILINNVISETMILIPAVAAVLYSGEKLSVLIPFHKIRPSSVFLTFVYIIALFPVVAFVNYVSMLFVENSVTAIADDVLDMPMWAMILSIGIFGPFVEEIVFRGVILQSYQRTGRIIGSILLSSVMFGMMHMNFNQFAYGTVMGIMLALLVEATGSVLTSFIAHAFFNTIEVVMMFATGDVIDEAESTLEGYLDGMNETVADVAYTGYLLVAALIFAVIAYFIVRKIARNEGRISFFDEIKNSRKQGYKLITIPLVVSMMISVIYMLYSATL
ncbi:MAG: CPBP family intramembrane metalloprotease [Butyrivibrio sp.]|nr:CPBP family intramembrane metalloprotease [Butyrivibrio sp.]